MRLALLSDIHGNLPALEAVWTEVEAAAPDLVADLGDIASGPLWPRETVQWLMAREREAPARWRTIRGNHERQALAPDVAAMGPSDAFAARALGDVERTWLAALPPTLVLPPDVLLCHGTPADDLANLTETVIAGFGVDHASGRRAATPAELRARLGAAARGATLVACGHTHVPRVLLADTAGPLVVNPGSVGLPAFDHDQPFPHVVENGSPHARWALAERTPSGWRVELRATPYDWRSAAARAEANGRGDWADALATGRVGRTERQVAAPT